VNGGNGPNGAAEDTPVAPLATLFALVVAVFNP
jgi:hypothetical protein